MGTPPVVRVVERELRVFGRLWRGSIFSGFLNPVLFLAAIGFGLGGLVDEQGRVDGLDYLEFVAPGLLAASSTMMAAGDSLWPVLGGMKWMRTFHGMAASPLTPAEVAGGELAWTAVRAAMSATAFVLVAAALGAVPSPWGVLAVPAAVLGAAALAAPVAAFSATQDSDVGFPVVMRLGVLPMFLFSGTFFPVDQLPAALRPLAAISPLWHTVELCRAATTGTGDGWLVAHAAFLVALLLVGSRWSRRAFTRRLAA